MDEYNQYSLQATDDGRPDDWATHWNIVGIMEATQPDQSELLNADLDSIFRAATEPAFDERLPQAPLLPYRRPVYQPPVHSRAPPPPPLWTELSNTVKLLLIRELTTWYSYRKATALLQLTNGEELAFRRLYNTEMQKKHRYDDAMHAYTERVKAGYEALHGGGHPVFNISVDLDQRGDPSCAESQSERPVPARAAQTAEHFVPGLKIDQRVAEPNYETDHICMRDFDEAWRYLDWVGIDARSVDLAHWTSHVGADRFKIELADADDVFTVGSSHHLSRTPRPLIATIPREPKPSTTTKPTIARSDTTARMAPRQIEQKEIDTYWNIFSNRTSGGKFLTGDMAAPVLKNSGLRDDQLERVWDLADVDNDGNLDFEEFCVAMRLIFDILNGEYPDVPNTLPDWLVPESKAHLVQAGRALTGKTTQFEQVEVDDDDAPSLKDGFDWYMSPADKSKYEQIYLESRDMRGDIAFPSLQDLYDSLDVPDTDIRSAWNLINPAAAQSIHKDACLAFLHILNNRHEGFRIPRTVPASLRASFERNQIDYQVGNASTAAANSRWATRADENTATGRKAKFGDQYLTRLGRSGFKATGTDFSQAQKTEDWEEVRLKKQLADLEGRIQDIEAGAARRSGSTAGGGKRDTKPALVKRELEQLLDYKRNEVRDLEDGTGKAKAGGSLKSVSDDLQTVREQVESLESHLRQREQVLDQLRRDIDEAKAAR